MPGNVIGPNNRAVAPPGGFCPGLNKQVLQVKSRAKVRNGKRVRSGIVNGERRKGRGGGGGRSNRRRIRISTRGRGRGERKRRGSTVRTRERKERKVRLQLSKSRTRNSWQQRYGRRNDLSPLSPVIQRGGWRAVGGTKSWQATAGLQKTQRLQVGLLKDPVGAEVLRVYVSWTRSFLRKMNCASRT